jgi:hypothetical protein
MRKEKTDIVKLVEGLQYFAKIMKEVNAEYMCVRPRRIMSIPHMYDNQSGRFLGEADILLDYNPGGYRHDNLSKGVPNLEDYISAYDRFRESRVITQNFMINVKAFLDMCGQAKTLKLTPVDIEMYVWQDEYNNSIIDTTKRGIGRIDWSNDSGSIVSIPIEISDRPTRLPKLFNASMYDIEHVYGKLNADMGLDIFQLVGTVDISLTELIEIYSSPSPYIIDLEQRLSLTDMAAKQMGCLYGYIYLSKNLILKESLKTMGTTTLALYRDINSKDGSYIQRICTPFNIGTLQVQMCSDTRIMIVPRVVYTTV